MFAAKQQCDGDALLVFEPASDVAEIAKTSSRTVIVVPADLPLLRPDILRTLLDQHRAGGFACTAAACFRGARRSGGIYCFETPALRRVLGRVGAESLSWDDMPETFRLTGETVGTCLPERQWDLQRAGTALELARNQRILRRRTVMRLMRDCGVLFIDAAVSYLDPEVQIGRETVIYPGTVIEGNTSIGRKCEIRSGVRIFNSRIGDGVLINDHSVILDSEIAGGCAVGPFAHLRGGTRLEEESVVGNFVEVKNSRLGRGSKAKHLSYLGDAEIGQSTNIGAGTITCNWNGGPRNATIIENNVKIGADTLLVAPVRVHAGAATGAGSVVTRDVPPNSLVAGVPAVIKKKLSEK
jgi:bifunctional UDP-N-acetylglucosamine pyrophosphorylase/glucosamine-1-phosphate N-acetyltransferase